MVQCTRDDDNFDLSDSNDLEYVLGRLHVPCAVVQIMAASIVILEEQSKALIDEKYASRPLFLCKRCYFFFFFFWKFFP